MLKSNVMNLKWQKCRSKCLTLWGTSFILWGQEASPFTTTHILRLDGKLKIYCKSSVKDPWDCNLGGMPKPVEGLSKMGRGTFDCIVYSRSVEHICKARQWISLSTKTILWIVEIFVLLLNYSSVYFLVVDEIVRLILSIVLTSISSTKWWTVR